MEKNGSATEAHASAAVTQGKASSSSSPGTSEREKASDQEAIEDQSVQGEENEKKRKFRAEVASEETLARPVTSNDEALPTMTQHDSEEGNRQVALQSSNPPKKAKKNVSRKTKKDPKAPKRFKSSYIFYAQKKYKEIESELAEKGVTDKSTVDITKMVSSAWRNLSAEEKAPFEEMSKRDKARFEIERDLYKGTWTVPVGHKRTQAVGAPKRPESAFLAFSNKKRADLKLKNPTATNGEISKMLAKIWSEAPDDVRRKYQGEEKQLREKYKVAVAQWRAEEDAKLQKRKDNARRIAEIGGRIDPSRSLDNNASRGNEDERLGNTSEGARSAVGRKDSVESNGDDETVKQRFSNVQWGQQASALTRALREARAVTSGGSGYILAEPMLSESVAGVLPGGRRAALLNLELLQQQDQRQFMVESALLDAHSTRLALQQQLSDSRNFDLLATLSGSGQLPGGNRHFLSGLVPGNVAGVGMHGFAGALHSSYRANQMALGSERSRLMQQSYLGSSELPETVLSQLSSLNAATSMVPESISSLRWEQQQTEELLAASIAQRQQLAENPLNEASFFARYGTPQLNRIPTSLNSQGRRASSAGQHALALRQGTSGSVVPTADVDSRLAAEFARQQNSSYASTRSPSNQERRALGLARLWAASEQHGESEGASKGERILKPK